MNSQSRSGPYLMSLLLFMTLLVASCGDSGSPGPDGPVGPQDTVGPVGPVGDDGEGIDGSGDIVTEDRDISGFDQIVFRGEGRVVVTQGNGESLTIETDANLLEFIETDVRNGALEIRTAEEVDIDPTDSVEYRIEVANLASLEHAGVGTFEVNAWTTEEGTVVLTGVGDVRIGTFTGSMLSVQSDGVGAISVGGTVAHQEVTIAGLGTYEAGDLESETATIYARDSGSATVWVQASIDVVVSDLGSVSYFGTPRLTKQLSGSGIITGMGAK